MSLSPFRRMASKSVVVGVCAKGRGKFCTCVSHLEESLRNDLHLFSDL